jgi:hypothetical protein
VTQTGFGFYFEEARLSATQGAIAPAEQYFEGSRAEVSVVRETGQNSLDAVAGDDPVHMEFELREMPTASVPGIQGGLFIRGGSQVHPVGYKKRSSALAVSTFPQYE